MEWDKKEISRVMDRSRWLKEQPPERMRLQMVQRVLKSHRKYKKLSKQLKYRMKKLQKLIKVLQKKKTLQKR